MKRIFLGLIYTVMMRNFLRYIVGVKFHNKASLKIHKQFILVSNHNSHLDTMALLSSLTSSQLAVTHPVAAGDYFGKSPFRSFLARTFVNAVLIPRKTVKGNKNPISIMNEALDKGRSLILFPEGSRGEPEKMQEFKKGVGILLKTHPGIPYIPVFMKGMGKVLPKGEMLLVPFDTYVCFGEPTYCKSTEIDLIALEIEKTILDLYEKSFVKREK